MLLDLLTKEIHTNNNVRVNLVKDRLEQTCTINIIISIEIIEGKLFLAKHEFRVILLGERILDQLGHYQ